MNKDYINVTTHEFKSNISKYLKMLRLGEVKMICIHKNKKLMAVVQDYNPRRVPYPRKI